MAIILYLVNDAKFFGATRQALAQQAQQQGHQIYIAGPDGEGVQAIRAAGLTYHFVPFTRRGMNPWREIQTLLTLKKLLKTLQPDILHTLTIKPIIYGGILARFLHIPILISAITGLGFVFSANHWQARCLRPVIIQLYRWIFAHPNQQVIVQNNDDDAVLMKNKIIQPHQYTLIRGSGVDLQKFSPLPDPPEPFTVALITRMLWDKGVADFVSCAQQLKNKKIKFLLVGDPDPGNPNSISIKQLQIWQEEVGLTYLEFQADIPKVLQTVHVVCLPSYYGEGVPRILLEAQACTRPVITSDHPGCRDVVENGVQGFLIPVRNAEALAEKICYLQEHPEERRAMGIRGRSRVEQLFSLDQVIHATLKLYQQLLESR